MQYLTKILSMTTVFILSFCNLFYAGAPEENHKKPMQEQFENSQRFNALLKKVHKSVVIDDMENSTGWTVRGLGKISFTSERSIDGKKSLRFRTPMRDEEFIKRNAAEHGTFDGNTGGSTTAMLTFRQPQDWTNYNRLGLWIYVHPTEMRSYTLTLRLRCLNADTSVTSPNPSDVIQRLLPGKWNYILWEIPNLQREKVTEFGITQNLRGSDPEVENIVTYDIDHIELQQVDEDKYQGWEVEKGKIAFNHAGYKPGQAKTALASELTASEFQLINCNSGKVVLTKPVALENNNRGRFQILDFSEVTVPGKYYIKAGDYQTRSFVIADTIWREPIAKAINFYYCERCGYDVPNEHRECHRDWQGIHNGVKKIINGGWHDAGDLSQGSFRTGPAVYAMLELINQLSLRNSDADLQKQILDEALWGLEWLLKTRFGDGYRITWSTMRIYTDCKIGTPDDVVTPAQNTPWENFLAAGVEAFAYNVLKDKAPGKAVEALLAAEEDWDAAVKKESEWLGDKGSILGWAMDGNYLPLSWGIVSSIHLFKATGNKMYAERAIDYGRQLMNCQERSFLDGIPITGFFYTSEQKRAILHHMHPAFEESPLLALTELCKAFPENENWMEWYGAAVLHSEYFMKRGANYSKPFTLIPNSVYRRSELMSIPDLLIRADALRQFAEGTRLTDEYHLRVFPIWLNRGFHGNTAVHLSETLALTLTTALRSDLSGEAVVNKQLQWVFGGNPFSQSLMYGEGYDFVPQFAFSSGDIVGSLPVGMDCMKDDAPYWTNSNYATYKEVWVVPVSRFLWNAAYLGMPASVQGRIVRDRERGQAIATAVVFQNIKTGVESNIQLGRGGSFNINLPAGEYEIKYGTENSKLSAVSGGNYSVILNPSNNVELEPYVKNKDIQNNTVQIGALVSGRGMHSFTLRVFNGYAEETQKQIRVRGFEKQAVTWDVHVKDNKAPWVAVIIPDGDMAKKKELTGTMEEK